MDRIIRTSTEHFLNKLDNNREFHTPVQLLEAGLPEYLVQRIRLDLMRNLQESVKPPQSDWANMAAESVTQAWDQFLQAIREEIRLPSSYAGSVMESALSDILELLVTPRAFLPDYLFGSKQTLELSEVRERCEWIVVYRYFSGAIPRFMEKKGRNTLTREQADRIIERLDERVTSHYTSLNWGQLFEPWFTLMGDTVDPSLFAKFFRDKGKPGVARLFDAEEESIHRTRLIEILSRPQLEDDEDDLSDITSYDSEEKTGFMSDSASESNIRDREKKEETGDRVKPEIIPAVNAPVSSKEKENQDRGESELMNKEKSESDATIKNKYSGREFEKEKAESETRTTTGKGNGSKSAGEDESREENLLSRFRNAGGDDEEDLPLYSRLKKDDSEESDDSRPFYSSIRQQSENESSDDIPIWQRFSEVHPANSDDENGDDTLQFDRNPARNPVNKDTTASSKTSRSSSSVIDSDASSKSDRKSSEAGSDNTFNAGRESASKSETVQKPNDQSVDIRDHVRDMEQQFVEELFGGDESAFLEALGEIEKCNDWKQAGKYISKEVFDRNMIDIYSDMAIYFTDRMQTYFLERSM